MPEVLVPEATSSASERADRGDQAPSTGALLLNSVPKLGSGRGRLWASSWS